MPACFELDDVLREHIGRELRSGRIECICYSLGRDQKDFSATKPVTKLTQMRMQGLTETEGE